MGWWRGWRSNHEWALAVHIFFPSTSSLSLYHSSFTLSSVVMGGLLSCLNPPDEGPSQRLVEKESYQSSPQVASTSERAGAPPPALVASKPPPKFKISKRSASKRASEASSSRTASGIFCRCGGPGSLVQLLPCKCHSLCLMCAQAGAGGDGCPDCGAKIDDSIPSWKTS